MKFANLMIVIGAMVLSHQALADEQGVGLLYDEDHSWELAQLDGSDAYDPFVDYSEFDEASDEEADINFFRHGRFFTIGLAFGNRIVTGEMKELHSDSLGFGLNLSYFFDLRFALQFGFLSSSNHAIDIDMPSGANYTGSASISTLNIGLKYYLNTQNITKGLAQFNPYILGGLAQVTRKTAFDDLVGITEDSATGLELGGGIEFPLLRKKMYFGAQLSYLFVTFSDENTELKAQNDESSGIRPAGDFVNAMGIIGINF